MRRWYSAQIASRQTRSGSGLEDAACRASVKSDGLGMNQCRQRMERDNKRALVPSSWIMCISSVLYTHRATATRRDNTSWRVSSSSSATETNCLLIISRTVRCDDTTNLSTRRYLSVCLHVSLQWCLCVRACVWHFNELFASLGHRRHTVRHAATHRCRSAGPCDIFICNRSRTGLYTHQRTHRWQPIHGISTAQSRDLFYSSTLLQHRGAVR